MARFSGLIGFSIGDIEVSPGVWEEDIEEKQYFGDVVRKTRQLTEGENANLNLSINNTISIVADKYANDQFFAIRYVRWMGACWTISNIEVASPRLLLQLGGLYNGPKG